MTDRSTLEFALRKLAPDHGLELLDRPTIWDEADIFLYQVRGVLRGSVGARPRETKEQTVDRVDKSLAEVAARAGLVVRAFVDRTGIVRTAPTRSSPGGDIVNPAAPMATGTFRIYFNRAQAAPLVWCIALANHLGGDRPELWELAVAEWRSDAPVRSVYAPKATPDSEDGRPSAWIEVDGVLTIAGSVATIASAS